MPRLSALMLLFILNAMPGSTAPLEAPAPPPSVCTFQMSQTVRIPISTRRPGAVDESDGNDAAILWVTPGAKDELPDGPSGFDVLEDGGFVVTDPLRSRLVVFDSEGKFRQEWKPGFAADSVTMIGDEVLVQEASTGSLHVLDEAGRLQPKAHVAQPRRAEASVLTPKNGAVARIDPDGQYRGAVDVRFDRAGASLLSLEALGTDRTGNTFIALESTVDGEASQDVNVNKVVRKYDPVGILAGETSALPLDYFVTPVDELRVRNGNVYQLQTTRSEVRINVWNTNQGCSRP